MRFLQLSIFDDLKLRKKIQKKVIRTLCKAGPLDYCRPLFIHTEILTVIRGVSGK